MARRVLIASTVLVGILLAGLVGMGCGDGGRDGEGTPRALSKREYIEQANGLQARAAKVFATLDGRTAPATPAAAATHLAALDELIAGFEKLRAPRDWREEHATLVSSLQTMRDSMSTISRASTSPSGAAIITTQLGRYRAAQRGFEQAVRDINADR